MKAFAPSDELARQLSLLPDQPGYRRLISLVQAFAAYAGTDVMLRNLHRIKDHSERGRFLQKVEWQRIMLMEAARCL